VAGCERAFVACCDEKEVMAMKVSRRELLAWVGFAALLVSGPSLVGAEVANGDVVHVTLAVQGMH
jgi:hypothetical protein